MELRLLGPVEIISDSGILLNGGVPQRRALLAALAVDAGRLVTRETLIDRVWDDSPPAGVQAAVYAHVTRIRDLLEQAGGPAAGNPPARLCRQPGGYVLQIEPDLVDLHQFRGLVAVAQNLAGSQRAALLRQAVGLRRGEPLAGVTGRWAARMRQSWENQWLDTVVAWAHAELAVGNPGAVLCPLADLAGEHPLLESVTGALMSALASVGRTSDALDHYRNLRRRLADELGIDPGSELQALHKAILRGEPPSRPALAAGAGAMAGTGATAPTRPRTPVPAQLPGDVPGFIGRAGHLARLTTLLAPHPSGAPATVVISAVSGTAGIGKTALAVHWAHQARDRFPDGQLYVNLRGFDPSGTVMTPSEAVCGFLDALGVPPQRVPSSLDAQIGLYRSLIADKRMLVLLDNARDAEQARPLLPASSTAVAVVTSRNRLTSLTATDGAQPMPLDLLTTEEARDLLARRLSTGRITMESAAIDQIITACARLPLALTIVAARAQHSGFPLAALAKELGDARGRLDALNAGDTTTEVRAVFSWSYATLTEPAARLFRLLGLHPGPDICLLAAASLAGKTPQRVRRCLAELVRTNLLTEHAPGRYAFHDLLRAYAVDLALELDSELERDAAVDRLLAYYLRAASAAARHLAREDSPPSPGDPELSGSMDIPALTSREEAADWFALEQANLVAAAGWAAVHHHGPAAVGIPASLHKYLRAHGPWPLALQLHRTALTVAEAVADRPGQARALTNLSDIQYLTDDYAAAATSAERALELSQQLGDRNGQASALQQLGVVQCTVGDYAAVVASTGQALELCRQLGDWHGQAHTLYVLGAVQHATGDHAAAIAGAEQALELCRRLGDWLGQARALYLLGLVRQAIGDYPTAAANTEQALELYRPLGDRHGQAEALNTLALIQHATGDHAGAAANSAKALELCQQLGDRNSQAEALNTLALVRQAAGEFAVAANDLGLALDLFRDIGDPEGEAKTLNHLGDLLLASGSPTEARERFTVALAIARTISTLPHEARALEGIGTCALGAGDVDHATVQLRAALAIYQRISSPRAERVAAMLREIGA